MSPAPGPATDARPARTRRLLAPLRVLVCCALAAAAAACGALDRGDEIETTVIQAVPVDQDAMLAQLNGYRARSGLPALAHDPRLDAVSADMALLIAEKDSMDTWAHSGFGLARRLDAAGYDHYAGAENLGAGYASLEAAFAGWRGSAGHDRNLLNPHVSRVGIARVARSDGKWRHFWVMTLARPQEDGRPPLARP
ncbi:CAP domain-containing protein [Polymorphum gilvum]|uniref:SCP-like extracellular protein, putative n=1 Tax=Polymorphum gilvum (strain LMG 25793 / CGMCC 1.9160 / SL003B-26A1) TaxID=991905 RepID=F2IXA5_POLGS|nr:CAP domain-containing protein [Polymorphum gilvum]ADZ70423.1 SCP-like extracellular protein, putative [Polymorphum gilvum SL003B-26A1]